MNAVGMGWYTPEAWARLEAMPEARIQKSYEDFVHGFEWLAREVQAQGFEIVQIRIDIDQMVSWCHRHGYAVDSAGRAAYGVARQAVPSLSAPIIDNTRILQ
jgi:hypothetical protein